MTNAPALAPRFARCGCCTAGCVCLTHSAAHAKASICAYHREHPEPRQCSPLALAIRQAHTNA